MRAVPRLIVLAAILLAVAAPAAAAGAEIELSADGFEPEHLEVDAGETILWRNTSEQTRTIVAGDGTWGSGELAPGETFSLALRVAGTHEVTTEDGEATGTVEVSAAPSDDTEAEDGPDPHAEAEDGADLQAEADPHAEAEDGAELPETGLALPALGAGAVGLLGGGVLTLRRAHALAREHAIARGIAAARGAGPIRHI